MARGSDHRAKSGPVAGPEGLAGEEVLAQVDDIRKQLLGGPCDALIDWAKQHGIAREQLQWTMEV
mgnify:CR=1 FL=1